MINLKLKTIASLINKSDHVIDVACDHAYLAIYLKKNKLCQSVIASDISAQALNGAEKNIKEANLDIPTFLSDGFTNIPDKSLDTAIIAGVGTYTILDIVKSAPNNIKKFIISSNNNYAYLREKMANLGFYCDKEIVIKEHNKFYPIMVFIKSNKKDNKFKLKYGKSNNPEYFNYLIQKEKDIINKLDKISISKIKHYMEIHNLKKCLKGKKQDY